MKIVDAAKIMDIARIVSFAVMLACMALLFIRFMNFYLSACVHYLIVQRGAIFDCPYARKRVVNRIVHDHKNSVFTENPDSRAGLSGTINSSTGGAKG